MAVYRVCGDIRRSGVVEVEAASLKEALEKAERGEMTIVDEQSDAILLDGEPVDDASTGAEGVVP